MSTNTCQWWLLHHAHLASAISPKLIIWALLHVGHIAGSDTEYLITFEHNKILPKHSGEHFK